MCNKIFLSFLATIFSVATLSAQTAEEWLGSLNKTLGSRYTMNAVVQIGDAEGVVDELNGLFMVDGDGYYLSLGVMEVYSDGKLRYEVNNERKEATIDRVDLTSHDLLTNPTKAFTFAHDEFQITLQSASADAASLGLVPREDIGIANIELQLKRDMNGRVLPESITYDYDGDVVKINLSIVKNKDATLPRWDDDAYRAYDVVSFL